jgi:hypothetical protein
VNKRRNWKKEKDDFYIWRCSKTSLPRKKKGGFFLKLMKTMGNGFKTLSIKKNRYK